MQTDPELWNRIRAYEVASKQARFYRDKLKARNWTNKQLRLILGEYKRFLYLCAISERPLTPSPQLAQLWQLHLSFSEEYWDYFCAKVVGKPLYFPEPKETAAMRLSLDEVRALYLKEFGTPPRGAVWQPPRKASKSARRAGLGKIIYLNTVLIGVLIGLFAMDLAPDSLIMLAILAPILSLIYWLHRRSQLRKGRRGGRGSSGDDAVWAGAAATYYYSEGEAGEWYDDCNPDENVWACEGPERFLGDSGSSFDSDSGGESGGDSGGGD